MEALANTHTLFTPRNFQFNMGRRCDRRSAKNSQGDFYAFSDFAHFSAVCMSGVRMRGSVSSDKMESDLVIFCDNHFMAQYLP